MGPFVVDASLTLSWCFEDEATQYTRSVLTTLQTTYAVVPALFYGHSRLPTLLRWQNAAYASHNKAPQNF